MKKDERASQEAHNKLILEEFTRQAVIFAQIPGHSGEAAAKLLVEMAGITSGDTILDAACGPGLLAAALAPFAGHVTGIDLVPAMIEQAKKLQAEKKFSNMTWKVGDVLPLPFPEASFSAAVTRYTFHHFFDPAAVLREMVRVVKPGGRVAVVDVFTASAEQSRAYDALEKLRDPSHVHAFPLDRLRELVASSGLKNLREQFYRIEIPLEQQYKSGALKNEDVEAMRKAVHEDIGKDRLGWGAHRKGGDVYLSYPTAVFVGEKPASERSPGS